MTVAQFEARYLPRLSREREQAAWTAREWGAHIARVAMERLKRELRR